MSVTLTLVPLAVAVGLSLTASSTAILAQHRKNEQNNHNQCQKTSQHRQDQFFILTPHR
jgi:hypothetical protein